MSIRDTNSTNSLLSRAYERAVLPVPEREPEVREETITPELASEYLASMVENRTLRSKLVGEYAAAMRAGRWALTHQGIAFDTAGRLIDGQHRLSAVIRSGRHVRMLVTRGLRSDAVVAVDSGLGRSTKDALGFSGCAATGFETAAGSRAYGGAMAYATKKLVTVREEEVAWIKDNILRIRLVCDQFKETAMLRVGAVAAACVRASLHGVPDDRIERFIDEYYRNVAVSDDSPAAVLARHVSRGTKGSRRTQLGSERLYGRTEKAISLFLEERKVYRVDVPGSELFRLPHDPILAARHAAIVAREKAE